MRNGEGTLWVPFGKAKKLRKLYVGGWKDDKRHGANGPLVFGSGCEQKPLVSGSSFVCNLQSSAFLEFPLFGGNTSRTGTSTS